MNKTIKTDLYRYRKLKGISGFFKGVLIAGFKYTLLFRLAQKYENNPLIKFPFLLLKRRYMYKYGFQIPTKVKIGKGLYLNHFGTIIINPDVVIGDYCTISSGVTIGQINRGSKKGSPLIGDRVSIGANSVIVGKITIGSNVLIAPNSFVNKDVPDNSIVLGNPANVTYNPNATYGYIGNILDETNSIS